MSSPTTSRSTSTDRSKAVVLSDSDSDSAGSGSGGGGRSVLIARLKDVTLLDSSPTNPYIPPPIWGRVLDFMPYEEVSSALSAGKIIVNEAVKYVRTLNFMKSCQLDGPSTRRFPNVEEVNCLCLISGEWNSRVLCRDTIFRLVPLLTTFTQLRRIYVGGLVTHSIWNGQKQLAHRSYRPYFTSSPENHRDLVKVLCQSLLGAFKARLLPQELHSKGNIMDLFESSRVCHGNGPRGVTLCETCADICSCFPIQEIIEYPYFCHCVDETGVLEAIAKREGARKFFRKESGSRFYDFLGEKIHSHELVNQESKEEDALRRKLADLGVRVEEPRVRFIETSDLNELDRLITLGFDPRVVSNEILYDIACMNIGTDDREYDVFARTSFDALVARGFAIDEADVIVLDEKIEPALKDLVPAFIRGEYLDGDDDDDESSFSS